MGFRAKKDQLAEKVHEHDRAGGYRPSCDVTL
jgi:hypothetical protein